MYCPSNWLSILLDTPRALTSHEFIERAIPSCIVFYCQPFRAILFNISFSPFLCTAHCVAVKTGIEDADYKYRICSIRGRTQIVASLASKMKHLVAALK